MIDTVVDGVTGVHVSPRDPDRVAEAARGLLEDPARRAAYGRAGVRRARRLYDWDRDRGRDARRLRAAARLPSRPGGGHAAGALGTTDTGVRAPAQPAGRARRARGRRRPARALGPPARDDAARGRTAAGRRQRRQRGAGPASDGGAGRALRDRAPRPQRAVPARRHLESHGDRQRLRRRGGLRPPGSRARPARRRPHRAEHVRAQPERPRRRGRGRRARDHDVGADRATRRTRSPSTATTPCACRPRARATVQELHLVALHIVCGAVDREVARSERRTLPAARGDARRPAARTHPRPQRGAGVSALVVVGDALLDRDVVGTVERLSPDAPVPVVDQGAVRSRPGGAGLAAALLAAADAEDVTLVTALGDDAAGDEVRAMLADARRRGRRPRDATAPTPEKIRIGPPGRPLLRLDRGAGGAIGAADAPRAQRDRAGRRRARRRLRPRRRRRARDARALLAARPARRWSGTRTRAAPRRSPAPRS